MRRSNRILRTLSVALVAFTTAACAVPTMRNGVHQAQYRAWQLHQANSALATQNQQAQGSAAQLAAQNSQLQQQLQSKDSELSSLQGQVGSLQNERNELENRYISLVNKTTHENPLSDGATKDLEDLARRYPDFDFDPQTGVSKFHSDILFESGSSELREAAVPILQEFVAILNREDSQRLNILVVGHTDDKPIVKASTRTRHGDNWDLSAHRAVSVTRTMGKLGLRDNRMGVAGYGPHQPVAPNTDAKSRQRNRRVEIFVLAPNASVAGRDNAAE